MKLPSESKVLIVLSCIVVAVICFCGFVMEYGWFGYGHETVTSMEVTHGFSQDEISSSVSVVFINTASVSQLQTIPGLSEYLARQIVLYRMLHGNYTKADDLLAVEGLTEETIIEILPYIIFE